jgi:bifunctional oligoribonuclease and PAP phosphatase NrnA
MNPGLANVRKFIQTHDKFIISTHESPDPDGIGSEIAFKELLDSLGKTSMIINGDPTPEKFKFMDPDNKIQIANEELILPADIHEYVVVVLDTNSFNNTGHAYHVLFDHVDFAFIIDHHEGGEDYIDSHFVKVEASSTSEIVYDILISFKVDVSPQCALALYAGIIFDTGSFRYKKTSSKTFIVAAYLAEKGIKPHEIYDLVFENNDIAGFLLRSLMLSSVETYFDGRMILMHLTPEMLHETGANFSQGEANINLPLSVKQVEASVLLKQDINGPLKVSMRTKGDLDVADIALKHQGGGHKNAAGFKSPLSRDETRELILKEIGVFFPN